MVHVCHERDGRLSLRFGKRGDRRRDVVRYDIAEIIPPVLHATKRSEYAKDMLCNPPIQWNGTAGFLASPASMSSARSFIG